MLFFPYTALSIFNIKVVLASNMTQEVFPLLSQKKL